MWIGTEVISSDLYTTSNWKTVQVRTATVIKEDDVELSRSFHQMVLTPGTISTGIVTATNCKVVVSGEDAEVKTTRSMSSGLTRFRSI